MKYFTWDEAKNQKPKKQCGVSFEEVIIIIKEKKQVIVKLEHLNQKKYSHQQIYVLEINHYIYLVPCVEDDKKIFLKTIIPSRKFTKKYLLKK